MQRIDKPETQVKSFSEFLDSLPEFNDRKPSEIIRDSNIERTYGYQIFNGRKLPGRDKVIMISLALHLNLDMTQKALAAAKAPALYPRDRRDAIIIYAVEHSMSVDEACDLLDEFGEKILD
ncbi:MAG: XRE family transcriptional regulator [Lachnospiraceae bacterium]|nr:XRE family transcriptional regulator [Lachnospiraceae bacterium]